MTVHRRCELHLRLTGGQRFPHIFAVVLLLLLDTLLAFLLLGKLLFLAGSRGGLAPVLVHLLLHQRLL